MNNVPKLRFKEFDGEWEEKKLLNISQIYDGTHQTPKYLEEGVPFVSVENIKNIIGTNKYISKEAFEKEYKIKPQKDDILMTRITAGIIGDTAIIENNNALAFYVSLALIRINNLIHVYFLNHYINSLYFKIELHKRIIHTAFPKKINLGDIGKCLIKLPQKPEQEKIASFLTSVDTKIEQLAKKEALLREYKKGVMSKIFNQEIRFKDDEGREFPEWEEKKLGEIAKIYQPKTISQTDLTEEGYDVYGANGIIGKYSDYNHEFEQIAVTCRGNTCGTVNYTKPKSWITGNAMIINLDNSQLVLKLFLYNQLIHTDLNYLITGSGQPQITGDIKNHKVNLPSIKEQTKIANFLSSIDKKIELTTKELNSTKEFKKALLQQIFV